MSATTADSNNNDELRNKGQQSPLASQRAKAENNDAKDESPAKRFGYFPVGYKEGFSQWWASVPAATAEHAVMSYIPFLKAAPTHVQTGTQPPSETPSSTSVPEGRADQPDAVKTESSNDPYGPRQWHSNLVKLSGKNRALNEFSVERVGEEVDQNMVMLHGYGAGLGFFYKNFEGMSRSKGWKIYALDLLGMGRSTRPPFKMTSKDKQKCITEAENWFIDALEEWRIKKNIDRFTLMGHSLGGYMAVAYALKYPGHLNKLVLASPVGIPEDPYAVNADLPEPNESTLANEVTQDQDATTSTNAGGDNNNFLNARSKRDKDAAKNGQPENAARKPLPKWLTYLWDANISPFSLVRWSGPLGPRLVSGWTSRRFSHLGTEEAQALHTYAYSLFRQRGSGEYALAYILAPGAFARSPLIRRIHGVGRQYLKPDGTTTSSVADMSSSTTSTDPTSTAPTPTFPTTTTQSPTPSPLKRETGIPIVLMYGENDWMDVAGGYAAEQKLKEAKAQFLKAATTTEDEKSQERGEAKVLIIKKAGHHVYLDGWEEFNEVMRSEMEDVSVKERERKRKER